ncbi:MAG TPA: TonB family protein [Verrucomicrobiae bacterium]
MDANQTTPAYELKDELARLCLPSASRDANQKLAWVNSVCILFLLVGIFGARRGLIAIKPAPPLEEIVPVIVQPLLLPPQPTIEKKETPDENKNDTPQVNVVIPQSPGVNFSVPTIGSVVVPASLAVAPPLEPMRTSSQIGSLNNTGSGGERPEPPYPPIAKETGEQGTIILLLGGDAAGNVVSVDVKESSGFPVLDRATVDFLKRHWRLPAGTDSRLFQTSITYKLQF